ncbi:MAG: DUF106 domain-containing protein [Thermoplasmatota archaeon]
MAAQKKQSSSMLFFFMLMLAMLVLFDEGLRGTLADAVGAVFFPLLGFDHQFPVLTIFLAGSVMIFITTVIRHFTMDWIAMARNQAIMSKFQKEYRQARLDNNTYKIKKLEKLQPELMKRQTEVSSKQMKVMPITFIVIIPVFTWIWDFLMNSTYYYVDVPWAMHVNMFDKTAIFPNWILLYMLLSIPLTQVIQYAFKILSWKERKADVHEG